jgi:hypothetical protein
MKILRTISMLTFVIVASSCSGVKVVTDSSKKPDFSGYETFSFEDWQDVSDELFSKEDKKLIRDSFKREFSRRGFKPVSKGDMHVSIYLVTSNETAFSGYSDYVGGRGGGNNHYGGGYGYGYSGNTYKQQSKLVGTLIMNVYDGKSRNQIWQAIATGTVNENPKKDRSKTIPGSVASIMRRFPVNPK